MNKESLDWVCDICNKPESEVGNLFTGRTPKGRDFQICKKCLDKMNFKKTSDVDKLFDKEDK